MQMSQLPLISRQQMWNFSLIMMTVATLDELADRVEVSRLIDMSALKPLPEGTHSLEGQRHLQARFVRTWRPKILQGESKQLRRSRLVAKEFAWLDPGREHLYAPATSSSTSRLIPAWFMHHRYPLVKKEDEWDLMAVDISDAYLTRKQDKPTVVTLDVAGRKQSYSLNRCIPGQRDGAAVWFREFTEYLAETLSTEACVENPSMFRIDTPHGSVVFLMRVDDMFFCWKTFSVG